MADLPFEVPFEGEVIDLPADVPPVVDGCEQVASYYVGEDADGTWRPPGGHDADLVTVTTHRRLDMAEGLLVPHLYQVTFWRRVGPLKVRSTRVAKPKAVTDGR